LSGVISTLQLANYIKNISKKQLEHAFGEFYRGLILLQNYATLNAQATEKILKKHDKVIFSYVTKN
jgi:SPX domain protein involved in polyphosphate accumulation